MPPSGRDVSLDLPTLMDQPRPSVVSYIIFNLFDGEASTSHILGSSFPDFCRQLIKFLFFCFEIFVQFFLAFKNRNPRRRCRKDMGP